MIVIVGSVVLLAAVVVGFTGVLTNSVPTTYRPRISRYSAMTSPGRRTPLLFGVVVRRIPMLGLSVLSAGVRRTTGHRRAARHGLEMSLTPANQSPAHISRPYLPHSRAMNTEK